MTESDTEVESANEYATVGTLCSPYARARGAGGALEQAAIGMRARRKRAGRPAMYRRSIGLTVQSPWIFRS
jgi:hypothetical protein